MNRISILAIAAAVGLTTACGPAAPAKPHQFVVSTTGASASPSQLEATTAAPAPTDVVVPTVAPPPATTAAAPARAKTTAAAPRSTRTTTKPPPPAPKTTAPAPPRTVTPGAFCSPAGATGVTKTGKPMICKSVNGDQPRWRS